MKVLSAVFLAALGADALSLSKHGHGHSVAKSGSHHHHDSGLVLKKYKGNNHHLKKRSSISDGDLKVWNEAAGWSALVQGIGILVLYFTNFSDKNFGPLTTTFLQFNIPTQKLDQKVKKLDNLKVNFVLGSSVFLLLTAFSHFSIVTYLWPEYVSQINNHINTFRWIEYSVTSTIMIALISVAFGVFDISTLLGLAGCNFVTQYFGYYMELINQGKGPVNWSPYLIGWVSGLVPWAIIGIYFWGSAEFGASTGRIPDFVYAIVLSYFFFFNTFPINMALQYAKVGPWADYRYGELAYMVLSLVSKSLLSWLVVGNSFAP